MGHLIESIIEKLTKNFNGKLNCEEQRADLFVYVDGESKTISEITTEKIYFEDDSVGVDLYEVDIHTLAYIDEILN
jgi:hypothetical protein